MALLHLFSSLLFSWKRIKSSAPVKGNDDEILEYQASREKSQMILL